MKNSSPLRMEFRTAVATSLFILSTILVGCTSLVEKGLLPELALRQPIDVELGQEVILLDKPPLMSSSLIDKNGIVHVFVVNKVHEAKQLNHIEIVDDKITKREVLGIIETKQSEYIDAVEHPYGTLRVLAGDKQYIRTSPNQDWQEVKGNRCARFLSVGDELFCAFVTRGEEISTPKRRDYIVGIIIILPLLSWDDVDVAKIVLAQETPDRWIVRAVVDPETLMDASKDFLVGTDSFGNIHFLYYTSKGGYSFGLTEFGVEKRDFFVPELRYAKLTFNELLVYSKDIQNKTSSNDPTPSQWITVNGIPLTDTPFIKGIYGRPSPSLRPLNRHFALNKATGELNGIMFVSRVILDDGKRRLPFYPGAGSSWVELSLSDGKWSPNFNIVTATDFPTDHEWPHLDTTPMIKSNSQGNNHLLLEGLTSKKYILYYLLKENNDWSTPLNIGYTEYYNMLLSLNDSGDVFAAWVNKEGKFIGRWIKSINKVN